MGTSVKLNMESISKIGKTNVPIIICNLPKRYKDTLLEIPDETISLNLDLSQNLIKFEVDERADLAHQEALNILTQSDTTILLKDFEMLFDPRYKIDVVRLLIEVSRKRKILAVWPGTITENELIYANLGASDYQVFNINNYDMLCVY